MVSSKMQEQLSTQINIELFASYSYLSMCAFFQEKHLDGLAHWMRQQAQEELEHAMKIYDFMLSRDVKVDLRPVDAPNGSWGSPMNAFEEALRYEQKSTEAINTLVDLAISDKDHATHIFLEWFVTEQVEEEASIQNILEKLRIVGEDANGLLMLDHKLGQRA